MRERVGECTIEAPSSLGRQAAALAGAARQILPRLEAQLGVRAVAPYRIVLLGPHAASNPLTAGLEASAPPWAAGFMIPDRRVGAVRIELANRYPYGTIEAVFAHEVTHLLIHDGSDDRVPRWFNEGVATRAGRQWSLEDAFLYATSLLTSSLPPMTDVNAAFHGPESNVRIAYAASSSFVAWAERHYGERFVADMLRAARTSAFDDAWRRVTGVPLAASEAAWRRESLLRYRWLPAVLTASGMLWAILGLLTMAGGIRRKLEARAQRARWAVEEAAAEAAWEVDPFTGERRGRDDEGGGPAGPEPPA